MTAVAEAPTKQMKASGAKLTLPLRSLQKALAIVAPAVERKTTIPILGSVKIEQLEGAVEFTATNLDLSIQARYAMEGLKAAEPFLLPALKLTDYAKLLQGDAVGITPGENRATLQCGRSNTKLPTRAIGSFPKISDVPDGPSIRVKQGALERLLKFTSFAISDDSSRPTLSAALVEMTGDTLSFVSTDGHRLARYTVPIETDTEMAVLAPKGFLAAVQKTIGTDAEAIVRVEASQDSIFATVRDDSGAVVLSHKRLTGQFPNYKAIMPQKFTAVVKVSAEEAAASVRRAGSFADERSGALKLTVSPDAIKLHAAAAEMGETDDIFTATTETDFEAFSIGFNDQYLLDALSRLSGNVELRFSGRSGDEPLFIAAEPADGEHFECVVMPLRV